MDVAVGTIRNSISEDSGEQASNSSSRSERRARRKLGASREELGLSTEERAVIDALRSLRAEEKRMAEPRPELLKHGYVTLEEAAHLLGRTTEQLRSPSWSGEGVPVLKDGRVPLSEVRREAKRLGKERLDSLARSIQRLVRPESVRSFMGPDEDRWGYDIAGVAEQLKLSKAAVKRLISENGPMFSWKGYRGTALVTTEEVEAYRRTYLSEAPHVPRSERKSLLRRLR